MCDPKYLKNAMSKKEAPFMVFLPVSGSAPLQSLMQRHSRIQCARTRNPSVQNKRRSPVIPLIHVNEDIA